MKRHSPNIESKLATNSIDYATISSESKILKCLHEDGTVPRGKKGKKTCNAEKWKDPLIRLLMEQEETISLSAASSPVLISFIALCVNV